MKRNTIEKFIEKLSSESPTPGGGGVAALNCAIASALALMVYNLTIDKKIFNNYDETIKTKLLTNFNELTVLQESFLDDIQRDADDFLKLMESYKLPKDTTEEKEFRSEKIQEGYLRAIATPMALCEKSLKLYDYLEDSANYGNPNVISDAAVGILNLYSAIQCSVINIKINLKGVKNEVFVKEINEKLKQILSLNEEKKNSILKLSLNKINIDI
ncbi:cyclodeaminase/cyclohydrolase family protein [Clostridium cellulovorans]|uniref:Formiminotransferase-cyclodeaminase n=1 Tax=Clostridium cellulovorans (strain ATCC 35296 / DSM 3052 / OCM 3 / 743B) TaxID=573061 RepID=D9SMY9_CLOC7|nr:cyclodeaminase/cyclohydrolase family protein [Clostridium cellulovorans]ADL51855.1 Formiminotransferase-cyclodeaminase [Clostridium cellulovorans 743B]